MEQRKDKGTAGLTILLSLIVMLFVIGLLVMIYSIMSGKMADTDSLYARTSSISVGLETIDPTTAGGVGTYVANGQLRQAQCSIVAVYNGTTFLTAGNYTEVSECKLKNLTVGWGAYKVNYTYTYLADQYGSVKVINDSAVAVSSVTDWFDIFIVIGAMVVLILLTVIIITAIRSSGMVEGGNSSATNRVGTA